MSEVLNSHFENHELYTPEMIAEKIDWLKAMWVDTQILEAFKERALAKCQVASENPEQNAVVCEVVASEVDRLWLRVETDLLKKQNDRRTAFANVVWATGDEISDILWEENTDYPNAA